METCLIILFAVLIGALITYYLVFKEHTMADDIDNGKPDEIMADDIDNGKPDEIMADDIDNGQPDETKDEEYPVCPECGERHPPENPRTRQIYDTIRTQLLPLVGPTDQAQITSTLFLRVLSQLSYPAGASLLIRVTNLWLEVSKSNRDPGQPAVDLTGFVPTGKPN